MKNVLFEPSSFVTSQKKKKKKEVLSQLPYMQEEQTHNKAMQLNPQIPCMYRLKYIQLISTPLQLYSP